VENAKFEVFSLTKLGSDPMSISLEVEVSKLAITQTRWLLLLMKNLLEINETYITATDVSVQY